jgi:molybdopterin-synthase adenylyltransferase
MKLEKYSRQILFRPIGREGQEKISQGKVVIVGCGALGTAHASALTRCGVGKLRIVDRDFVEESNLQRQVLFDEADVEEMLPKAIAAGHKLRRINSDVEVESLVVDATSANIEELVDGFDVLLDGTDNLETRYLLNDVSVKLGIPWIYGAAVASSAMTMTILPGRTPCLACVFPELPQGSYDTCDTTGIISPAVTWASAIQVAETLKLLIGKETELHASLLSFDVWENRHQQLRPARDPKCRACAEHRYIYLEGHGPTYATLCGRDAVEIRQPAPRGLDLGSLQHSLAALGSVRFNDYLLRFNVDSFEMTIFPDGRAIIKGTGDLATARGLYAKYIGS